MFNTGQVLHTHRPLHTTHHVTIMKNLLGTLASATLFATMYHAPYATILTILALIVLSDIWTSIAPTTPVSRADDKAAWDAIFEEPDPIEPAAPEPAETITRAELTAAWDATRAEIATIFVEPESVEDEEPIVLSYRDIQHEIKARYTASQRKELGIKLNASRAVLESWL